MAKQNNNKPPAFQFYVKDWLSDFKVRTLKPEVRAAYVDLLCHLWNERDTSLPDDSKAIAQLLGVPLETANEIIEKFCSKGIAGGMAKLWQEKLKQQKLELIEYKNSKSHAGKKGAKARWDKQKSRHGTAIVLPLAKGMAKDGSSTASSTASSSSNKSPTEIKAQAPKNRYGDENINNVLEALKGVLSIDDFADAQKWQRIYAKHLYQLLLKIGQEEFRRRLDILREDSFKSKRMNEIRYVYEQMKGFIEPQGGKKFTFIPKSQP